MGEKDMGANDVNRGTEYGYGRPRRTAAWWIFGGAAIALLGALVLAPFYFHPAGMYPYFFYGYHPGFLFFPFGLFAIVFLFFFLARWLFWGWGWRGGYGRGYYRRQYQYYGGPAQILKERYARGELTKEQFDQMMRDIQ
jgi:putative membrane protein